MKGRFMKIIRMAVLDNDGLQWLPVFGGYDNRITHYERVGPAIKRWVADWKLTQAQETTN